MNAFIPILPTQLPFLFFLHSAYGVRTRVNGNSQTPRFFGDLRYLLYKTGEERPFRGIITAAHIVNMLLQFRTHVGRNRVIFGAPRKFVCLQLRKC